MSHPIEFRRHILRIKEQEGLSFSAVALRFSVGVASVKRWSKRLEPKPYERRKIRKIDPEALAPSYCQFWCSEDSSCGGGF